MTSFYTYIEDQMIFAGHTSLYFLLVFVLSACNQATLSSPVTTVPIGPPTAPPSTVTVTSEPQINNQPSQVNWWDDAVFYEIFVRSFQDSDGDGVGDLNGLISRLDYLQELGVTGLWLMPIAQSPSYHLTVRLFFSLNT